jgi:transposase-like protein
MLQVEVLSCPYCSSENIERIKRPPLVKLLLGRFLKSKFQCKQCNKTTYFPVREVKQDKMQRKRVRKKDA